MEIRLLSEKQRPTATAWVLALFEDEQPGRHHLWRRLGRTNQRTALPYLRSDFHGRADESRVILLPKQKPRALLLIGLGPKKNWTLRKLALTTRRVVATAKQHRLETLAWHLEECVVPGFSPDRVAQNVAENLLLANYEFTNYKTTPKEGWPKLDRVELIDAAPEEVRNAVRIGQIIAEETNECRRLANTPGSEMTPKQLAAEARKESRHARLRVRTLNEPDIRRLKMGGILGVASGSANRSKFIIMEYRGGRRAGQKPIVLVGKGVTFDSGGLNLKPEQSMQDMHMDMSGAAAVIHAIAGVARLKLPLEVAGLIPAVENMPGSSGFRPGDLLKTMSGKTIEVQNTDAEGRIILADALAYAKRYDPQLVVDVATLTGAAIVALGQRATALFTPNPKLEATLRQVGEVSGDYVWPLPLWSEYEEDIKGTFGDVANLGKSRWGGAITAATFLWQFTKDFPAWAHLDIAPTMTTIDGQFLAKGASGTGVRFLVEMCRRLAAGKK